MSLRGLCLAAAAWALGKGAKTPCGLTILSNSPSRSHPLAIFCNVLDRWVDKGGPCCAQMLSAPVSEGIARDFRVVLELLRCRLRACPSSVVYLVHLRGSAVHLGRLWRDCWVVSLDSCSSTGGCVVTGGSSQTDRRVFETSGRSRAGCHIASRGSWLMGGLLPTRFTLGHRRLLAEQTCCLLSPAVRRPSATC